MHLKQEPTRLRVVGNKIKIKNRKQKITNGNMKITVKIKHTNNIKTNGTVTQVNNEKIETYKITNKNR